MTPAISGRSPTPAFSVWRGRSSPSIPDRWRPALLVAAAIAIGWVGWSGHALTLPCAMLFPALWAWAPNRVTAAAVSMGYFLAASRGLPQGIATFFTSDLWLGVLLWLGASLSFVLVQTALWTPHPGMKRALRFLLATGLMAVPPFGIVGWAQPATAAGVLFPGCGWWGLAATMISLAMLTMAWWCLVGILLASAWLWSAAHWEPPVAPPAWTGIEMTKGARLGRDASIEQHRELIRLVLQAVGVAKAHVVVLPENAIGIWTPTVEHLWRDMLEGRDLMVIAGAMRVDHGGYDSIMVGITTEGRNVIYRARMPVPVAMWQPWRWITGETGGARAHFFANPTVEFGGNRLAPLICYEQLVLWPVLESMLYQPDLLVGISNAWWAGNSSIPSVQRVSLQAWARLFDRPLVISVNM
ncbi:conjugal transfer protein TraB [Ancylobacter oerskovii]|uniref:Conjugal transfer protein TraB n=1 Tax=Ancylobacter oerskovii TaxID=459519 RepID=A0ABW4Z5Z9_9HYPH|nr:conjugal transfer protein TraB [Ancylobacter oerskovii]MBS7546448.1 conjugal transfer protein TraB [Ancylobacter oerskovii]